MINSKKTKQNVIIWLLIGVLAAVLGFRMLGIPKKNNYTEIKVTTGNIATYFSFSGSIEAKNRQTIFADKAMQVKEIRVKSGEEISSDTVLMTTSMGEEIKSEVNGEVSKIHAAENAQLMPGTKLVDIVDYSDLQLKVQVDEYDLSAVSNGKTAVVTIHALDKDVNGKITDVSKEGEYLNGVATFTAIISLPKDDNLRIGMSAEAKVLNQSVSGATLLPMSAIQFDDNNNPYVLVKKENGSPRNVEVDLGINDGVHVEIISGVTADDSILVPPTASFADFGPGMRQNTNRQSQGSAGGDRSQ